jgi:hypothetical protein
MTRQLNNANGLQARWTETPAPNSTYPKGGVFPMKNRDKLCSKDSFVVNETLVFQIKFCGESPALRVTAKRIGNYLIDSLNASGNINKKGRHLSQYRA